MPADRPAQERGEGIRRAVEALHAIRYRYFPLGDDERVAWAKETFLLAKEAQDAFEADVQAVRREARAEMAAELRALDFTNVEPGCKRFTLRLADSLASEPAEGSKG